MFSTALFSTPIRLGVFAVLAITTTAILFTFAVDAGNQQSRSVLPTNESSVVDSITRTAALSLTVNDNGDSADVSVGNGICDSSPSPGDQCTLRAAIQEANFASGSDTITFSLPPASTITLLTALPDITTNLTITGPGPDQLAIARSTAGGTPNFRILFSNNVNVNFSGFTVTNGRSVDGTPGSGFGGAGGSGGGIFITGGSSSLSNLVITGNRTGDGGSGGTSTGGFGGFGGGLSASGTLVMTNVTISNNVAGNGAVGNAGGSGGRGGGFNFSGTSLTMTDCLVTGNTAGNAVVGTGGSAGSGGEGGGIDVDSGTINLTRVKISNNTAGNSFGVGSTSGGHGGGLITVSGVTSSLTDCVINNNFGGQSSNTFASQGGFGGGIFNGGPMTINRSLIYGNETKGQSSGGGSFGGGIFNANSLSILNTTISNNRTDPIGGEARGGGIYHIAGSLTLIGCTITRNEATDTAFEQGQGLHSKGTTFIASTIIAGNTNGSQPDVTGNFTSGGHNLIGKIDGNSNGLVNGNNNDQVGSVGSPIDPLLGPLANNGGLSLTHALLPGSPALDKGDLSSLATAVPTDQRGPGFIREADGPDADLTATVDIGAYETQPPVSALSSQTTGEDTTLTVAFDVTGLNINSIAVSSSNTVLVPINQAHLSFGGGGSTRTVIITPAANQFGVTTISLILNTSSGPVSGSFQLTVNPVADTPSVTAATTNEDTRSTSGLVISRNAADGNEVGFFKITGITNGALFLNDGVTPITNDTFITFAQGNAGLSFIPAANSNVAGTFNVQAATGSTDQTLGGATTVATITVNPVNDDPTFTKGPDQFVNEDSGARSVFGWATNLSAGPSNESSQTLSFEVIANSNTALFSTQPAINSSGTLTFTPAANAFGTAAISVVIKDNGGTLNGGVDTSGPQTFNINVVSLNDAPSFVKGANQTVDEDSGAQTVSGWATSISPGPTNEAGQTVSFTVMPLSPSFFAVAPAITPSGDLSYMPALNVTGTTTVLVTAKDNGGTTGGGQDTSAQQSFTITLNPVNDAPVNVVPGTQTISANTNLLFSNGGGNAISVGDVDATSSRVTLSATNGVITLNGTSGLTFSLGDGTADSTMSFTGSIVNINARLNGMTFSPTANFQGVATFQINSNDLGSTGSGGAQSDQDAVNINVVASAGVISFLSSTLVTDENAGSAVITVQRTGDLSQPTTVRYATVDHSESTGVFPCATTNAIASSRCDYTTAIGTLEFGAGESSKLFKVLISQDSYTEGVEGVQITLSNPTNGASLGTPSTATLEISDDPVEPNTNLVNDPSTFVTQHYHDFLNREPDSAGLAFWTNEIASCGSDAQCIEVKRINVSAAFFLSIEYQQTGFLVYRTYKAAFSNLPNGPVPVRFNEYLPDAQRIARNVQVGIGDWEAQLEANKIAYLTEFVSRQRFINVYPTVLSPSQFVDLLFLNTGVTPTNAERQAAIDEFGGVGTTTDTSARVRALRRVAENESFKQAEFNRAFVLMQYFGYMRRNPDASPDTNYDGWQFWLNKLNQFNGNFVDAEMVKAFIISSEYRSRFGPQ